jgi:tumor protein p53-inducible protein 3
MYAAVINSQDHSLEWTETTSPEADADEVLVRIRACGINRADLLQRRGLYDPPAGASEIIGLECAGEIVEVGRNVKNRKIGERVCALLSGGGYAELAAVHEDMLLTIPDRLSFEEAAAIPEAFYTAYLNLFELGGLEAGETVLVHSGGSGVGTAAILLAKSRGSKVIATAGEERKIELCRQLGADQVFHYKTENFAERILETSNGVDLILDTIGGSHLSRNIESLAPKGRLVLIGLLGGGKGEINLSHVLTKNISILGSTLRSKSLQEKIMLTRKMKTEVMPLFGSGKLRPAVDSIFPVAGVEQAHQYMLANKNFGKIILNIS